jgi:hypothetical protein
MKNKILINIVLFNFLIGMNVLFAQSDYEIVQNFKKRINQIEQQIRNADSLAELSEAKDNIEKLRSDFVSNEELLNRSLYPNNFDRAIKNLNETLKLRQDDFSEIENLQTEVTGLKVEVDTLNRRNVELTQKFKDLEQQIAEQITSLENTIAWLNESLRKRDQVVMSMIDSLLPTSYRDVEDLNPEEKEQLLSEVEQKNVLTHIKRAVNDNIRFLNATKLNPEDIEELRTRQQNFSRIWKSVGPTMTELYASKGKSTDELQEIDDAISRWNNELNREVWESIRNEFAKNNIKLQHFTSGEEFTSVVTNFINDEIRNAEANNSDETESTYNKFVDSTWNNEIDSEWIPFLIDNNMLAEAEKDTIEVLMASWKDTVYPGAINWLYILLAVVVIGALVYFFIRKSREKNDRNAGIEST